LDETLRVFDYLLVGGVFALAWGTLVSANLFRAVVLFIVFGLCMALAWARLRAPDVALAEAAIGAGISGALLLAAQRRRTSQAASPDARTSSSSPNP